MISGKDGHASKPARFRETDCPTELGRLLAEAFRCLESTDLYGANAALEEVHAEVASTGVGTAPEGRETVAEFEDRG